ncbi:sugar phosphate isomerase/epimerase family protein [Caproicibacter fermentans]|uniref:Sugar phosphate isomerase/epimerase n=1 Tax=Caproicibacter fermentans TaxID=2576756 RepID=A0A7G8TFQ8_9FIRM|nr:sugar phosphate isomerase/epimerase family protein [Caproicibacter fermentans]QNK42449.1 sugar phosphate isomerase/epimerase [Caproicibacter fermentans]
MNLATSTNIICERPGGKVFPIEQTLQIASEAGFRLFDMNFYDWALPFSPFLTDQWEIWINRIAEKAAQLGVKFGQCHAYTFNFLDRSMTKEEWHRNQELVERSLYCCSILGSRLCVTHPETDRAVQNLYSVSKKENIEYYNRLLEVSEKYNMELAIENMCDLSIAPRRKYCAFPEELVDLIDSFHNEEIGICWDFEHADIMKIDQRQALLYIGKRLKATHVSDSLSSTDTDLMHILPMFGTINWAEIMQTLQQIHYNGDFCFEAHNFANRLPDTLLPTAMKLSYEIGQYLLNLPREASSVLVQTSGSTKTTAISFLA